MKHSKMIIATAAWDSEGKQMILFVLPTYSSAAWDSEEKQMTGSLSGRGELAGRR